MNYETQVERLKEALIDMHIRSAGRGAGLPDHVIDDLANYAGQFSVGPDLRTVTHRDSAQTPDAWLTSMRESRPHWFGSQSSGGAESFAESENPWSSAAWNITKQGKVIESDYKRAEAMAKAAGVDVMAAHPKKA
jgi:hypothetical protein